jgi:uncharacterized protein involved in exopolysaccharide biosynthesis
MTQDAPQAQDSSEAEPSPVGIGELIRFVLQAARRHVLLGALLALVVGALGVTFSLIIPPEFEAKGKLLYNENARITPVLSNPDRMMPRMEPLANVADLIKKKTNLQAIIKEVKLADEWERSRSPILRVKDSVMEIVRGPITEEDKQKALVAMLEDSMMVYTEGANGLRIKVYWRNPVVAAKIVDVTIRRYLESQLEEETAVITTAIDILKKEVSKAAMAVDPALKEVLRLSRKDGNKAEEPQTSEAEAEKDEKTPVKYKRVTQKPAAPKGPDPVLVERLARTREAIRQVRDPWQRRLADLKTQLNDLRGVYGPQHPAVVQQQRRISEASAQPRELAALLTDERNLVARIKSSTGQAGLATSRLVPVTGGGSVDTEELSTASLTSDRDPPELVAVKDKLRVATSKFNDVTKRLDAAQLELTTAKVAFKYRYVVTEEPEPAKKPISPNRPRLVAASLFGALLLGLLAGGARELATGRFIDVWQVRMLGLPLLADVKSITGHKLRSG